MINSKALVDRLQKKDANNNPLTAVGQIRELVAYIGENFQDNDHDKEKLKEVIYTGKQMVIDTIMKDQAKYKLDAQKFVNDKSIVNPYHEQHNAALSFFINDPISSVANGFMGMANEAENDPDYESEAGEIEKSKNIAKILKEKEEDYEELAENRNDILNEKVYLMKNMKGYNVDDPIKAVLNNTKGNIFERMFGKTSKEWKDFSKALDERQKGLTTREDVDETAKAYLMHKIPGYNGEGLPKVEDIQNLSGTAKLRAQLCLGALQANMEARAYEEKVNAIEANAKTNAIIYMSSPIQSQAQQPEEEELSVDQNLEDSNEVQRVEIMHNKYDDDDLDVSKESAIDDSSILDDSKEEPQEYNDFEVVKYNKLDDLSLE